MTLYYVSPGRSLNQNRVSLFAAFPFKLPLILTAFVSRPGPTMPSLPHVIEHLHRWRPDHSPGGGKASSDGGEASSGAGEASPGAGETDTGGVALWCSTSDLSCSISLLA
jgi:hypothetical protein